MSVDICLFSKNKNTSVEMAIYVWIKVMPDGRPTQIICESDDNIDTLQRKIKDQLSSKFGHVDRDEIIVRHANGEIIDPGTEISSFEQSLGSSSKLPFLVDAPASAPTGKS
jgi:hypothetical protein